MEIKVKCLLHYQTKSMFSALLSHKLLISLSHCSAMGMRNIYYNIIRINSFLVVGFKKATRLFKLLASEHRRFLNLKTYFL